MLLDVKAKGVDISTTWKDLQIPRTHGESLGSRLSRLTRRR